MTLFERIINFTYKVIPGDFLNKLTLTLNSEYHVIEVIVYELSLGVNKENVDIIIELFDLIFTHYQFTKNILIKTINLNYYNIPAYETLYNHFNINNRKIILNDNEKLIYNNDFYKLIMIELTTPHQIQNMLRKSIEYENIEYFKYLRLTYTDELIREETVNIAIHVGNKEIIQLIIQSGFDIACISVKIFRESHHFDLMNYMSMLYSYSFDKPVLTETRSLYFHVVNHNIFHYHSNELDLTVVNDNYSKEFNINELIKRNCVNIIHNNDFKYNLNNLVASMYFENNEMFDYIIEKVVITNEYLEDFYMNILQAAIKLGSIKYVQELFKRNPLLILDDDLFKNNALHISTQQNSIEVFKFVVTNMSKENLQYKLQSKNSLNETPIDLLKKYNHQEYIKFLIEYIS